jgi:hypothetical protein
MYALKESAPGIYTLSLPLPPGTYRYVFYHNGEKKIDSVDAKREYTKGGDTVNVALVP